MLDYSACCCQGGRPYNEDSIGISDSIDPVGTFALADGLGGHGMGDIASSTAIKCAMESSHLLRGNDFLAECFITAQETILSEQLRLHAKSKMETTMVVLHIEHGRAYYAHIGDSRLYHFSRRGCKQLTMDHSVPQMLVAAGEINPSEIRHHPDRNKLLRVLGVEWESPRFTLCKKPMHVWPGDAFLLCSDGFWEYIEEDEMLDLYHEHRRPDAWLAAMKETVEKRGAESEGTADNFSAIAVVK